MGSFVFYCRFFSRDGFWFIGGRGTGGEVDFSLKRARWGGREDLPCTYRSHSISTIDPLIFHAINHDEFCWTSAGIQIQISRATFAEGNGGRRDKRRKQHRTSVFHLESHGSTTLSLSRERRGRARNSRSGDGIRRTQSLLVAGDVAEDIVGIRTSHLMPAYSGAGEGIAISDLARVCHGDVVQAGGGDGDVRDLMGDLGLAGR